MSIIVVILIIICGIFAAAFLSNGSREKYVSAVVFKGLASACFAVIGLLLSPGTDTANYIVAGLITGCAADIVIELKKVFTRISTVVFLIGSFLFLAGHILYLEAVFPMSPNKILCVVIAVVLTPPLMAWVYSRITASLVLKTVGVVYIGTVMLLNCAAISDLIAAPSAFTGIFAVGALLFLASDLLLVLNTFGAEYSQKIKNIYIGFYYAAQILIALSLQFIAAVH